MNQEVHVSHDGFWKIFLIRVNGNFSGISHHRFLLLQKFEDQRHGLALSIVSPNMRS